MEQLALERGDIDVRGRPPTTSTSVCAWTGVSRAGSVTVSRRFGDAGVNAPSASRPAAVDIDAVPWW